MKKNIEKKTKTVFIPKTSKGDDSLFVAVNGRRILVKKGETVELPLPFAQVIENSMMAGRDAENFIEEKSSIE